MNSHFLVIVESAMAVYYRFLREIHLIENIADQKEN
jgi:hypothetical protein